MSSTMRSRLNQRTSSSEHGLQMESSVSLTTGSSSSPPSSSPIAPSSQDVVAKPEADEIKEWRPPRLKVSVDASVAAYFSDLFQHLRTHSGWVA